MGKIIFHAYCCKEDRLCIFGVYVYKREIYLLLIKGIMLDLCIIFIVMYNREGGPNWIEVLVVEAVS